MIATAVIIIFGIIGKITWYMGILFISIYLIYIIIVIYIEYREKKLKL